MNTGSVKQSKANPNRYEVRFDLPAVNGKRRQISKTVTATNAVDAYKKLGALQADVENGIVETRMLCAQWFEIWQRDWDKKAKVGSSLERNDDIITNHLVPAFGAMKLTSVTCDYVQRVYNGWLVDGNKRSAVAIGLSSNSVHKHHTILKKMFGKAVQLGHMRVNPCEGTELPALDERPAEPYTIAEVERMFHVMNDPTLWVKRFVYDQEYMRVSLKLSYCGLRRGEVLGLRWDKIDFETGKTYVSSVVTQSRKDGVNVRAGTKGKGITHGILSERYLILPKHVLQSLKNHRARQAVIIMEAGSRYRRDLNLVCCDQLGRAIAPDKMSKAFVRLISAAGLKQVRLHDLRHTHAQILLEAGVEPHVIKQRLGHYSEVFTLATYTKKVEAFDRAAMELLDTLVHDDELAA